MIQKMLEQSSTLFKDQTVSANTLMAPKKFKRLMTSAAEMKEIQNGKITYARTTVRRGKTPTIKTPIAEIRLELGWSKEEFAKSLNTPLKTYQGWEQGRSTPPVALVAATLIQKEAVLKTA